MKNRISKVMPVVGLFIVAGACAQSNLPSSQHDENQQLSREQRRAKYLGENFDFNSNIASRPKIASIDELFGGTSGSYRLHNVIGVFRKFTHPGSDKDFDHHGFVYLYSDIPNLSSSSANHFNFGSLPNSILVDYQNPSTRMSNATRTVSLTQPSNFVSPYFPYMLEKNSDGNYFSTGKIKFEFNDNGFESYPASVNAIRGYDTYNVVVSPADKEHDYLGLISLQDGLHYGSEDKIWSYVYRISSAEVEVRFEKQYLSVVNQDKVQVDTYLIARYTLQP